MSLQNIVLIGLSIGGYKLASYVVANRAVIAAKVKAWLDKMAVQNQPTATNPLFGGGYNAPPSAPATGGLLSTVLKNPLLTAALAVAVTIGATKVDFKQLAGKLSSLTTGTAKVVVAEPSAADKTAVQPLLDVVRGKPGASGLSALYVAAADILERDTENKISTSGQLTSWLADAGTLAYVNTDYAGKFPGLENAMETVIIGTLKDASTTGDEDIALTPEKKSKLIAVLKACAWACQQ